MNLTKLLSRLQGVKGANDRYTAKCPAHNDKNPSLSICRKNGRILLRCFAGCRTEDILDCMGLRYTDLFDEPVPLSSNSPASGKNVEAEYHYCSMDGEPAAVKVRFAGKDFRWKRPDGSPGRGDTHPLYNWQNIREQSGLFIVEGEKDADTLTRYGLPAVSFPDGAKSKWDSEYEAFFRGKNVILLPDNDSPGREFMKTVAVKLLPICASVKTVEMVSIWKNAPEKADITDYLNSGGTIEQLMYAVKKAVPERLPKMYKSFSEIESTDTQWIWFPYIPRGKLVLLTSAPGVGKTFLSLYLCGAVSNGRPFLGESESAVREPECAVYQTAEDGIADTLKKRLEQLCPKPNYQNIYNIDESEKGLTLADTDRIEKVLKEIRPALFIFDPIQAYLGASIDMHRANEVRPVMARIGALAERYNCTFLMIMHNSKMKQSNAVYAALGSVDIPAVSRSMLLLERDPDNEGRLILCHSKSSLARTGDSILFHINNGDMIFDGFSNKTAEDIYFANRQHNSGSSEKSNLAAEIISGLLDKHKGWVPLWEVKKEMDRCGISKTTYYRVKLDFMLRDITIGFARKKSTFWLAPETDIEKFRSDLLRKVLPDYRVQ